ncbi:hypothetical protein ACLB2K_069206 [Fragaria x ananassa]
MPPKKKPPVKKQTKKSPPKKAPTKKPKAVQERKRANASDVDGRARKSSRLLAPDSSAPCSMLVIANEAAAEASKPEMAGEEAKSSKVAKMRSPLKPKLKKNSNKGGIFLNYL